MKNWLFYCFICVGVHGWGQSTDSLFFDSDAEMADYAYQNTNFNTLNINYFKNRMFEYPDSVFSIFEYSSNVKTVDANRCVQLIKHIENWDVNKVYNADNLLTPLMNSFYNLYGENEMHIPLFLADLNIHQLKDTKKSELEQYTQLDPFSALQSNDVIQKHVSYASLLLDSLNYQHVFLDFNSLYVTSNTGRIIDHITVSDNGGNTVVLTLGQSVDISTLFRNGTTISISVSYTNGDTDDFKQDMYYIYEPEAVDLSKELNTTFASTIETRFPYGISSPSEQYPIGRISTSYACADKVLRKPYLMIAGWGPFTDDDRINTAQEWPTPMWRMAIQMNQDGLIETLNEQGFDVTILQIFPPNAKLSGNAGVIEDVINLLNYRAVANGYHEELIVQGYSAGAMGARLALQIMENKHLNNNGPHPHTRLFVSTDGEHLGANVPLGVQHSIQYMWDFERWGLPQVAYNGSIYTNKLKVYALKYILKAPQSQEILKYFYEATVQTGYTSQLRLDYINLQSQQQHYLSDAERFNYPTFLRNISISNGLHTPSIDVANNYTSNHDPLPAETGKLVFEDNYGNHRIKVRYTSHGINEMFLYRRRSLFNGWVIERRKTLSNLLILDNAAGGIMFIKENPVNTTIQLLDVETFGQASTKYLTNFCFTPTVFTHNINNFMSETVNGYINYNFKEKGLMYTSPSNVISLIRDDHFGYPHLFYPNNHYNITPFDALFSCPKNNEHLKFNEEEYGDRSEVSDFIPVPFEPTKGIYKNFVANEAEGYNLFLQNRKVGYYTRPNYTLKVDFTSQNGIYMGKEVTNKTDFLPFSIEPNAVVMARAESEIVLQNGVHFKPGANVHLLIGPSDCPFPGKSAVYETNSTSGNDQSEMNIEQKSISESEELVTLYPNPSVNNFRIKVKEEDKNHTFTMRVLSLNGTLLLEQEITNNHAVQHQLPNGMYIVQLLINESWISKRLIVQ